MVAYRRRKIVIAMGGSAVNVSMAKRDATTGRLMRFVAAIGG